MAEVKEQAAKPADKVAKQEAAKPSAPTAVEVDGVKVAETRKVDLTNGEAASDADTSAWLTMSGICGAMGRDVGSFRTKLTPFLQGLVEQGKLPVAKRGKYDIYPPEVVELAVAEFGASSRAASTDDAAGDGEGNPINKLSFKDASKRLARSEADLTKLKAKATDTLAKVEAVADEAKLSVNTVKAATTAYLRYVDTLLEVSDLRKRVVATRQQELDDIKKAEDELAKRKADLAKLEAQASK